MNHGKCHPQREDYDLLTLVVIRLGDTEFRELEEEGRKEVAFRMFSKDQTPEMVSDIIERPMEYTMELHRQYVEMVHEKGNYTTE